MTELPIPLEARVAALEQEVYMQREALQRLTDIVERLADQIITVAGVQELRALTQEQFEAGSERDVVGTA